MIFRQLFEPLSSTYTYLLGCEESGHALLIDPVITSVERDLGEIKRLGLTLACTVETHIHADHITAALELKQTTGSKIAVPAFDRLPCADIGIEEGIPLCIGSLELQPLHTPGHTDGHFAYLSGDRVFTGDALLIDGCGRTDFQNGNAEVLFRSVTEKLFSLPDDCLVSPAMTITTGGFPPSRRRRPATLDWGTTAPSKNSRSLWRTSSWRRPNSSIMPWQEIAGAGSAPIICQRTCKTIVGT